MTGTPESNALDRELCTHAQLNVSCLACGQHFPTPRNLWTRSRVLTPLIPGVVCAASAVAYLGSAFAGLPGVVGTVVGGALGGMVGVSFGEVMVRALYRKQRGWVIVGILSFGAFIASPFVMYGLSR